MQKNNYTGNHRDRAGADGNDVREKKRGGCLGALLFLVRLAGRDRITGFVAWGYILLYTALIVWGSVAPEFGAGHMHSVLEEYFPRLQEHTVEIYVNLLRKSIHVVGYGSVAVAGYYAAAVVRVLKRNPWRSGALIALGLSVLDESLQAFSPFRTGSAIDVGINTIGILLGLALLRAVRGLMEKKEVSGAD